VEQFNSRYNFLNFSGLYRGLEAGLLITDYSSEVTPRGVAGTPGSTNNVAGETIGTGTGSATAFAGTVDHAPVNGGSLTISAGAFSFTDADGDGTLAGTGGAVGSFNYGTGQFSLTFPAALASGVRIRASYSYTILGEEGDAEVGTGSGPRGNATSGTTRYPIYSFNVEQAGNILRITDNNGALYEGNIGDIRSAGGVTQDNNQQNGGVFIPSAGDEFIAQFSASGRRGVFRHLRRWLGRRCRRSGNAAVCRSGAAPDGGNVDRRGRPDRQHPGPVVPHHGHALTAAGESHPDPAAICC
jgi:hypothetical protein